MGWNAIQLRGQAHPYLEAAGGEGTHFYFVHSYHAVPVDPSLLAATVEHGPFTVTAAIARGNVELQFGGPHPAWTLSVGDLSDVLPTVAAPGSVDRVVLDMLAPWENLDVVAKALRPGGLVCCYVATTTQLSTTVEALRAHGSFTEPQSWESMVRGWHVEGLAVRPEHRMVGHTGFLCTSRRLADGVEPPVRRRRPSKGAYGEKAEEGQPAADAPADAVPFRPDLP